MNREVYYVGEGREIIVDNGIVPSVRLSKEERFELKSQMYVTKQLNKAKEHGFKIDEYWMIEGFELKSLIPDIYNKKLKGVDVVLYVNDIIRQAKLILFG